MSQAYLHLGETKWKPSSWGKHWSTCICCLVKVIFFHWTSMYLILRPTHFRSFGLWYRFQIPYSIKCITVVLTVLRWERLTNRNVRNLGTLFLDNQVETMSSFLLSGCLCLCHRRFKWQENRSWKQSSKMCHLHSLIQRSALVFIGRSYIFYKLCNPFQFWNYFMAPPRFLSLLYLLSCVSHLTLI